MCSRPAEEPKMGIEPPTDIREQLERAAEEPDAYVLRLYVAGNSPRSQRAVRNLRRVCESLSDCEIEVIDIYRNRERARDEQIIGAPTLVKELPPPLRRLIGDLSDERKLIAVLEIQDDDH
jgi:circadian clock protein KaiB